MRSEPQTIECNDIVPFNIKYGGEVERIYKPRQSHKLAIASSTLDHRNQIK